MTFRDNFTVDPTSPTGLRWNCKHLKKGKRGGNSHHGEPAGYLKTYKGNKAPTMIVRFNNKSYIVSRVIWTILHGEIPEGLYVDHIDGNPCNNKANNLRLVNHAENLRNCKVRPDNSTGVVGVHFSEKAGSTFVHASYVDETGKRKSKSFSANKHGLLPAFKMAVVWRYENIRKLNEVYNLGYTSRHITGGRTSD